MMTRQAICLAKDFRKQKEKKAVLEKQRCRDNILPIQWSTATCFEWYVALIFYIIFRKLLHCACVLFYWYFDLIFFFNVSFISLCCYSERDQVVTVSKDRNLRVYDVHDHSCTLNFQLKNFSLISSICFNPKQKVRQPPLDPRFLSYVLHFCHRTPNLVSLSSSDCWVILISYDTTVSNDMHIHNKP